MTCATGFSELRKARAQRVTTSGTRSGPHLRVGSRETVAQFEINAVGRGLGRSSGVRPSPPKRPLCSYAFANPVSGFSSHTNSSTCPKGGAHSTPPRRTCSPSTTPDAKSLWEPAPSKRWCLKNPAVGLPGPRAPGEEVGGAQLWRASRLRSLRRPACLPASPPPPRETPGRHAANGERRARRPPQDAFPAGPARPGRGRCLPLPPGGAARAPSPRMWLS